MADIHSQLLGLDLHDAYHFAQETDPGAVGANLNWLNTSSSPFVPYRRNADNSAWIEVGSSAGSIAFTSLTDVPSSYSGQGSKLVAVNSGATGLNFVSAGVSLIATTILGSNAASITFSSIPQTFSHLQLVGYGASNLATSPNYDNVLVSFNTDTTGSNYLSAYQFFGSTTGDNTDLPQAIGIVGSQATPTGNPTSGSFISTIPGYSSSLTRKTFHGTAHSYRGTGAIYGVYTTGIWLNTAAISSIVLTPQYGTDFITGSIFSLYGLA